MLALLILAAVVLVGALVVLVSRLMVRDDEHSVAGYHRQLHTLEQIKTHTAESANGDGDGAAAKPAYPESAVRIAGSAYVRVTDGPNPTPVPPVPPPPVADKDGVVTFDDAGPAGPLVVPSGRAGGGTETFSFGRKDRAMDSMNRRPRRLGGPIAAMASVAVIIVVLVVAGSHKVTPPKHHTTTASTGTASRSHHAATHKKQQHHSSTTTTQLPAVSLPRATSLHGATYTTALSSYALVVSATTGRCYVQVDDVTTGATLFAEVMNAGQQQTIAVHDPITIDVGAPSVFGATVNGAPVTLPYGYQTPFNLSFVPAATTTSTTTPTN